MAVVDSRPAAILGTYLPPETADIIRARARAADRSVAAEIRRAIRMYLEDEERREGDRGKG